MKRKTSLTICILLVALLLCACTAGEEQKGDTVTKVNLTFKYVGLGVEVMGNPKVYIAGDLSNELKMESGTGDGVEYKYTYIGTDNEEIKQIYVKPPSVYQNKKIEGVSASAAKDSIVKDENGTDWFSIKETWAGVSAAGIELDMVIEPHLSTVPRNVEIVIDGTAYSGSTTAMKFDESGTFSYGEFKFSLPASLLTSLFEGDVSVGGEVTLKDDVTILISEVLKNVEVDESAFTSDVEKIIIVR